MVRSMTGFGRAEARGDSLVVSVEARSVNGRHLDVSLRLPRALAPVELDVRRLVASRVERGRVEVAVQVTPVESRPAQRVIADVALARELGDDAAPTPLSLDWLLSRPGVFRLEDA
ncbi:MAG TPA: YicC/YloC family endoribonuclease, partial [Candidatus Tectomicrobia bacterium]|nr:YicC/YloC family endoribonuclease [Candidatus Tectomicrobia bacterium]